MRNFAGPWAFAVVGCSLAGCGSGLKEFPTAETGGTLACQGKPVANVMVFFEPLAEGESAVVGKPAMGITDAVGSFQLSTYGDGDGAVVGKHRVRVAPRGKVECPCELNENVDVTQTEVIDGPNHFDILLKKSTGRKRPVPADEDE